MSNITTIWKKELKDTIRDRRTILTMIILPMLLMPILMIGMGKFIEYQISSSEEKIIKIAIVNEDKAPQFVELINDNEKIEIIDIDNDIREAVRNDEIQAGIIIPDSITELVDSQQAIELTVLRNSINLDSGFAFSRISLIANDYNNQLIFSRFDEQEIDPSILSGLMVREEDVATDKETGGFGLGFLLPLFIIIWSIVGGQYTAVDISAGEKERKTLESLLLTPASRFQIVIGKFFAVSTAALTSVIVAIGSMYAAIKVFGPGLFGQGVNGAPEGTAIANELNFSIDPTAIIIIFCTSILLVLLFSALQLSVSIFAKSYKEAQGYVGPLYVIVILPTVLVNIIPSVKPALWFFALPVVNAIMLFKEALIGVYDITHIMVTLVTLIIYSAIAIYISTVIYSKESVLFRS